MSQQHFEEKISFYPKNIVCDVGLSKKFLHLTISDVFKTKRAQNKMAPNKMSKWLSE